MIERYDAWRRRLPKPPTDTPNSFINIFRPTTEPGLDDHFEQIRRFQQWLKLPEAFEGIFPPVPLDKFPAIHSWVYRCSGAWVDRYQAMATRTSVRKLGVNGLLTSAFLGALAASGFDGEIDTTLEWASSGVAGAFRALFPMAFHSKEERFKRNMEVMRAVEEELSE